jgi:hypothetical protein
MSKAQRIAVVAFGTVASAILAGAFYVAMSDRAGSALTAAGSASIGAISGLGTALLLRRKGKGPPKRDG